MSDKIIPVVELPLDVQENSIFLIEQNHPNTYTHGYFKYPCRFIPEVPRWAIKKYCLAENSVVYDPFSGSGTSLVEASIIGFQSYGSEIDDVARLLTKVKTTRFSSEMFTSLDNAVHELISYTNNKDSKMTVAQIQNLEHWFPKENIEFLGKMRYWIDNYDNQDISDFLRIIMAAIIKPTSFADNTSPKPYVSSRIKKQPPYAEDVFIKTYKRYVIGLKEFSNINSVKPILLEGGALNVQLPKNANLAITSPPYINAFDYVRSMRLENLWLFNKDEENVRAVKKYHVGTEAISQTKVLEENSYLQDSKILQFDLNQIIKTDVKRAAVVNKFFEDMKKNLSQVYNHLNVGGMYVIVIGNSTIRGVEIESWKILKELGEQIGYSYENHFSYIIQNPYVRIPRGNKGGKINEDHFLILKK